MNLSHTPSRKQLPDRRAPLKFRKMTFKSKTTLADSKPDQLAISSPKRVERQFKTVQFCNYRINFILQASFINSVWIQHHSVFFQPFLFHFSKRLMNSVKLRKVTLFFAAECLFLFDWTPLAAIQSTPQRRLVRASSGTARINCSFRLKSYY